LFPFYYHDDDDKHIKFSWSTARVAKIFKQLNPNQKEFVEKHGFGYLVNIKKFTVPVGFLEWVMHNTSASAKQMVIKVLGIPCGDRLVDVDSRDFEIEALVEKYKAQYKDGDTYSIKKCIDLMLNEYDEKDNFMRHFMLFIISTILIPVKSNSLTVEYLYSLVDLNLLPQYDWAEEVLHVIMHEVGRFHSLRDFHGNVVASKHFYMYGSLPLLAVSNIYPEFPKHNNAFIL
jgi:hypothetical protein